MEISLSTIIIEGITNRRRNKPYPKSLHGLCYELAGRNYEHKHNVPSPFQPVIKKWNKIAKGTEVAIEIRIVDNEFYNAVIKRLDKSEYFILGSTEFEITNIKATKDLLLDFKNNVPPLPDVFKIRFDSQTVFSQMEVTDNGIIYHSIDDINMKLFLHSICKFLQNRFNYKTDFDIVNNIAKKSIIINQSIQPVQVTATQSYSKEKAVYGHLTLKITDLNEEEKQLLGKLVKLASYVGVGHKKAFGYGKVRLERYGA